MLYTTLHTKVLIAGCRNWISKKLLWLEKYICIGFWDASCKLLFMMFGVHRSTTSWKFVVVTLGNPSTTIIRCPVSSPPKKQVYQVPICTFYTAFYVSHLLRIVVVAHAPKGDIATSASKIWIMFLYEEI